MLQIWLLDKVKEHQRRDFFLYPNKVKVDHEHRTPMENGSSDSGIALPVTTVTRLMASRRIQDSTHKKFAKMIFPTAELMNP